MFTIRKLPYRYESFSSYLLRISSINKVSIKDFLNYINSYYKCFDLRNVHQLDINPVRYINFDKLERLTGLKQDNVLSLTLVPILKLFCTDEYLINFKGKTDSLIINLFNSKNRYFCSQCLANQGSFKLEWQLHPLKWCIKHNQSLQTSCNHCGKDQPYTHRNLVFRSCFHCHNSLFLENQNFNNTPTLFHSTNVELSSLITEVIRYLPNKNTETLELKKMIRKFLFICNQESSYFNSNNLDHISTDYKYKLVNLLKSKNDVHSTEVSILKLLHILNAKGFSFEKFLSLEVPPLYIKSLENYLSYDNFIKCLAPWCPNNKNRKPLKKVKGFRSKTHISIYICTTCCLKYGINKITKEWEEYGDFISLGYGKMRPLINKLYSISEISRHLEISRYKVNKLIAYLTRQQLLKSNLIDNFKPENLEKFDLTFLLEVANLHEQKTIMLCKKHYKISQRDSFYFYFDPTVHEKIYNV